MVAVNPSLMKIGVIQKMSMNKQKEVREPTFPEMLNTEMAKLNHQENQDVFGRDNLDRYNGETNDVLKCIREAGEGGW